MANRRGRAVDGFRSRPHGAALASHLPAAAPALPHLPASGHQMPRCAPRAAEDQELAVGNGLMEGGREEGCEVNLQPGAGAACGRGQGRATTEQGQQFKQRCLQECIVRNNKKNWSLKNMESKPENFMINPIENSVSPSGKRQKTLSDKGDQCDDAPHQVVIYKNDKSDRGRDEQSASHLPIVPAKSSKPRKRALGKQIGAFAAQCACLKWRLISTKEKYEEIREQALQDPFVCEKAREWKPDVTCDDPSDVSLDSGMLWAIDKPNIPRAPQGWERLIKIRGEGSTKFADVYYLSPTGTQLRSGNEVEKYLNEHPEYAAQGVKLSHFSFTSPAPLQKDYVRKRSQTSRSGITPTGSAMLLPPEEVQPISWAPTPADDNPENNMQLVFYNGDQTQVVSEPPEPESPPPAPAA